MKKISTKSEKKQYIFWYGFNHPAQVANLLSTTVDKVISKSVACTLKGYRRSFAGVFGGFDNTKIIIIWQN